MMNRSGDVLRRGFRPLWETRMDNSERGARTNDETGA